MTDGPGVLNPVTPITAGAPVSSTNPLPVSLAATPSIDIGDVTLLPGTAIAGKFGIDQTTPGTTNKVVAAIDQTTPGTTNAVTLTGYSCVNISTATTTVVKSGAGVLHLVNVNTLGTIASTATIYDNTAGSGTIIAIIDTLTLAGPNFYDINFATGCTVVTTGTAAPNITVAYR